jgi:hypothetical protein
MKTKRKRIKVRQREHVISTNVFDEQKNNSKNLYNCATKDTFDKKINQYEKTRIIPKETNYNSGTSI